MFTMDQVIAAQKAQFDAAYGLAGTAFEGAEKLIALNLATGKALMSESASAASSLLEAKDPTAVFGFATSNAQPTIDKAMAYSRQAYDIVAETGAEFVKAAESQATQAQSAFSSFVDVALKNAPAGTESAASFIKGAMAAQQNAQAAMQKAVKQASDMAQQSMQAVAAQTAQTVKATATKKR